MKMTNKLLLIEKQDVLGFMTDFYRDDNGNLYMTGEQIGRCLEYAYPREAVNKIFERFKDRLSKYSREVKLTSIDGKPRKTRVFDEKGIYLVAMKSNQPKAWDFQEAVAGILENLRKGYQVWLLEREKGKATRRTLTDAIKEDYPDSPHKRFMYKNFTDLVYRTVFGKTAKQLKEEYGDNIRDKLSDSQLKKLKAVEGLIENYIALGYGYDTIKSILTPMLE